MSLRAGIAGVDVTPDWPLTMECYPDGAPIERALDRLEVRAIVLEGAPSPAGERTRAALVSVDACGVEAEWAWRVRQRASALTGIPAQHILLMASHTHACPALTRFKGVAVDPAYLDWLEERLVRAVRLGSAGLRPVTATAGEGSARLNVNRRRRTAEGVWLRANPQGAVDRRVRVLRLSPVPPDGAPPAPGTLGGRPLPQADPLALLFSYPCHPTVIGPSPAAWSADYPGAARRFVERAYRSEGRAGSAGDGGADEALRTRALFLPGCAGDLRPHLLRAAGSAPDGSFREGMPQELTVLGRLLGSEVVRVAEEIGGEGPDGAAERAGLGLARREVYLPYARVPEEGALRVALEGPRGWWARAMLHLLQRDGRLPEGEVGEVHALRLGRHWLVTTPGETAQGIGRSIERGLAELGLARPERGDQVLALG
ncbi:MAG TPA: hypothetical protein VH257_09555, partial [Chloroflexota bacterium]|nr:hypothetical protein [Chloroflexota bacterium]